MLHKRSWFQVSYVIATTGLEWIIIVAGFPNAVKSVWDSCWLSEKLLSLSNLDVLFWRKYLDEKIFTADTNVMDLLRRDEMAKRSEKAQKPQAKLEEFVVVAFADDLEQARYYETLLKSNDIPAMVREQNQSQSDEP